GIGGDSGLLLAGVLNSVIAIWIITLGVIAVRETHSFTTGRALGATALATLAIIVLAIVLVVAVLAVTIGTVAGLTGA
ncbi:MAG TPA: hypothetical protein VNP73_00945, partial [Actinomycetota bacterium]|nr:hypothetical protein [Actinomycetota bacterium]